jgi:predicted phosphoribosyltransferase
MRFKDRTEAGQTLATELKKYAGRPDVLVLALPRGGVPVAFEVAEALGAPLDIFLVRKLGVPGHEELAMGAIASGGVRVLNPEVVEYLRIPDALIDEVAAREQQELERREQAYRGSRPAPDVRRRTVILIDDGLATGSTMRAAASALRRQQPARLVVAVPVAAEATFSQTTDEEVRSLLERASRARYAARR